MMARSTRIASLMTTLAVLSSCGFQMGGAYPERDGREYLQREGYPEPVIQAVIERQPLSHDWWAKLAAEDSVDVRFLVARNTSISMGLLSQLTRDRDAFVRGGAALNPNLTQQQIDRLSRDESHTTQLYVARNPVVSEEVLLRMHEQQGMELVWFAMNPSCPASLQKKMREENDEQALYWLELTMKNADRPDAPVNRD